MSQGALQWNFVEQGAGMPVLLVHGFPLDHSMWQAQLEGLSAKCHLIAPDLPGFGLTTGRTTDAFSMAEMADDLSDFLDQRQLTQPVVVCGLSMGGYIAFQFWKRHRHRLAALILCDTRAAADSFEVARTRRETADRVLKEGSRVVASSMIEKLFAPSTITSRPDLVERIEQLMLRTSPQTIARALWAMSQREDFSDSLAAIDFPVLLICGENDAITPLDEMRGMGSLMPSARLVPVHNAGHMAPLEQPSPVNDAIVEFLREIRPPRQ